MKPLLAPPQPPRLPTNNLTEMSVSESCSPLCELVARNVQVCDVVLTFLGERLVSTGCPKDDELLYVYILGLSRKALRMTGKPPLQAGSIMVFDGNQAEWTINCLMRTKRVEKYKVCFHAKEGGLDCACVDEDPN